MGKKTNSTKEIPKSKKAISKNKIAKIPTKRAQREIQTITNVAIVNFTPDEQSKILAIYHYIKNEVKDGSLDKTLEHFGKELEQLFGSEVIASVSTMKIKFEGETNSKAIKKALAEKAAKEAAEKAKLAAEAARKALEAAEDSDSSGDSDSSSTSSSDTESDDDEEEDKKAEVAISDAKKKEAEHDSDSSSDGSDSESS